MVIFRNSTSFGSGVTVVTNIGKGALIWRKLSFMACKAIGLKES